MPIGALAIVTFSSRADNRLPFLLLEGVLVADPAARATSRLRSCVDNREGDAVPVGIDTNQVVDEVCKHVFLHCMVGCQKVSVSLKRTACGRTVMGHPNGDRLLAGR
jgi:hypothetical protein